MLKVFLDANILFSVAYREKSSLLKLWDHPTIQLITSKYALQEASRNLNNVNQSERLNNLIAKVILIPEVSEKIIPQDVKLIAKDRPILAAALAYNADYLITGDYKDFGIYFGKKILNTKILPPAIFFAEVL